MSDELIRLTARECVRRLERREITPLDLIDAAEKRIAACEPVLNALPTRCFERARVHARRLIEGKGRATLMHHPHHDTAIASTISANLLIH